MLSLCIRNLHRKSSIFSSFRFRCINRRIAGCPLLDTPRTDPDEPNSSIRLLSWVFDGKALIGPGMKDARSGKPVVSQFRHPIPREAVLLAAAPERSTPEVGHVMPKRRERPTVCGYRIISEMACNDLLQPVTLIRDSLVHSSPQLRLDFVELRLHAVAAGLSLKLEKSPARFTADEGEAQKREGVRPTDAAFLAIDRRAAAELNHAGLDRVERRHRQLKLGGTLLLKL